jgi:hypothetical protein
MVVKGITRAEDAVAAVKAGAAAVHVSNHGERVLDCKPAALPVLPRIADAMQEHMDSGRGMAIAKVLAVGDGGRCGGLKASTTAGKMRMADLTPRRSGRAARWRGRGGVRHPHVPPASRANALLATS